MLHYEWELIVVPKKHSATRLINKRPPSSPGLWFVGMIGFLCWYFGAILMPYDFREALAFPWFLQPSAHQESTRVIHDAMWQDGWLPRICYILVYGGLLVMTVSFMDTVILVVRWGIWWLCHRTRAKMGN
ncbi:MAG: hypothetical protein A2748_00170 [Candidatus Wildermuthbacteria bacterium RIFCSPHIGHO2_01_FULL_45_20]|uniref:Uncharacterized protein n=1 Tax=Candidatus Wildermuthbacteria bacterium RIFCSPHIGHO2_02_FULL_45_25 TaxID=1802450 RepID=A0A1G2R426_9BACT|nr:MAG: hypothetical protein A2748_00170 [Candidatus Wildermuthbacteria bacterium RIFCSPHIGHO2_01_FULL_45_20]OHA67318.1 MAG: hypothetical protein A3C04_01195 [Candidatus Wildermuthbacteria bacterium RIFCSPHIGHO2_02_FULL_45_25]